MGCVSRRGFGDTQGKHLTKAAQTDREDREEEGRGGIPGNGVSGRLLLQIAFTEILLAAIPHDAAGNQRNIQKQCFCNAQEVK